MRGGRVLGDSSGFKGATGQGKPQGRGMPAQGFEGCAGVCRKPGGVSLYPEGACVEGALWLGNNMGE